MNGVTTAFAYRGDGLRHSRTVGGQTTVFAWDINGGLPVVLDDGSRYVYGAGLVSQVSGANTHYLADGLGSTMATVDGAGNVVNQYTYDVYGRATASGPQANEFQFAGEQVDGSTGLQYLRARYYDVETGRFVSREPLAALPGWLGSPYHYADASPLNMTDPSGLSSITVNPETDRCLLDDSMAHRCTPPAGPSGPGMIEEIRDLGHEIAVEFCEWSPACTIVGSITLPAVGEYPAVKVRKTTKPAAQMLRDKRWTGKDYLLAKIGDTFKDKHGNTVWLRSYKAKNGEQLFDWIVENPKGTLISARKGENLRSAELAADEFKWPPVPGLN